MRKRIGILLPVIFCLALMTAACGKKASQSSNTSSTVTDSAYKSSISKGLDALVDEKYDKAVGYFSNAVDENSKSKQAKAYLNQTKAFVAASQDFKDNKLADASKQIKKAKSIKNGPRALKSKISKLEKQIAAARRNHSQKTATAASSSSATSTSSSSASTSNNGSGFSSLGDSPDPDIQVTPTAQMHVYVFKNMSDKAITLDPGMFMVHQGTGDDIKSLDTPDAILNAGPVTLQPGQTHDYPDFFAKGNTDATEWLISYGNGGNALWEWSAK